MSGHTVVEGKIRSLSVTQITKADHESDGGCTRRWWFNKVKGLEEPFTGDQETGVKVHSQIEHYLKTGEDVLGKIARSGRKHLPAPGPDLLVEWGLNDKPKPKDSNYFPPEESLVSVAGIKLIGFVDLINPRPVGDPPGTVECVDHKTSSDPEKWGKTAEDLIRSPQMLGYGEFIRVKYPNAVHVRLTHNTMPKKSGEAVRASVVLHLASVKQLWHERVEKIAEQMKSAAALENEEDVPANLGACGAFRGCHFRNICTAYKNQPPVERYLSMSLIAKTRGLSGSTNGAVPKAPEMPVASSPTPSGPPISTTAASDAKRGQVYLLPGDITAMFMTKVPMTQERFALGVRSDMYSFVPTAGGSPVLLVPSDPIIPVISTPEAQAPKAAVEAPKAAAEAPKAAAEAPAPVQGPPAGNPELPDAWKTAPTAGEAAPAAGEAPKRGLGKRRKIVDEAKPAEAPKAETKPAAEAPKTEAPKTEAPKTEAKPVAEPVVGGIRLFLNCVPSGGFTLLDAYVAEAKAAVEKTFTMDELRCAPTNDHPAAFGKWKGLLAMAVKAQPPAPGDYVVFTRGNEVSEVVAEALLGVAKYVVRGA